MPASDPLGWAVPDRLKRTILEVHGASGLDWLERFPHLLSYCRERWGLRLLSPFEGLNYNYVAPAVRADGAKVVVKLGFPDRELQGEVAALRCFDGRGAVRLLDADPDIGLLLLERLEPGISLEAMEEDDRATLAAIEVMRELPRPVPPAHAFPTVRDWAAGLGRLRARYGGATGPLPAPLVEEAEALYAALIESMGEPVVLHGDLHHGNILSSHRRPWLAIDPKGLIGEREYEVGALLRNPIHRVLLMPDVEKVLARRIDSISGALGYDRARVRAWSFAQAVLSAWWSLEDHGSGWETAIEIAHVLRKVGSG